MVTSESPPAEVDAESADAATDAGSAEPEEPAATAAAGAEPEQTHGSDTDAGQREQPPQRPTRLTFQITRMSLAAVIAVAVCVTPVASAYVWLLPVYLIPLLLLVWVLRVRTTVDSETVTVHTLFGRSRFRWDEIQSIKLHERRAVRAVLVSGKRIRLPTVRLRDLPRFAAMSGGRLPDPTASR